VARQPAGSSQRAAQSITLYLAKDILQRWSSSGSLEDEELEIVRRSTTKASVHIDPVLDADGIAEVQSLVTKTPVADHVIRYALRLVRATRVREGGDKLAVIRDYVSWGAGPRASENLVLAAKARAILSGSPHVTPEHIRQVAAPVLRHRILTNYNAEADQVTPDDIVRGLLEVVPVDASDGVTAQQLDAVTRTS